ncbi:hypothetical protein D3C84_1312580 [compost metagenome]
MMVMSTTGDSGMSREVGKLARVARFEHFNEHSTRIPILGDFIGESLGRNVAKIGGI